MVNGGLCEIGEMWGSVSMAQCVVGPLSTCKSSPEIPIKTARKLWRFRQAVRTEARSIQRTVV